MIVHWRSVSLRKRCTFTKTILVTRVNFVETNYIKIFSEELSTFFMIPKIDGLTVFATQYQTCRWWNYWINANLICYMFELLSFRRGIFKDSDKFKSKNLWKCVFKKIYSQNDNKNQKSQTLKTQRQISKQRLVEKYCSCFDKVCQFSAL